ncbi:proline-rich protein 36-like [Phyllostomus discolor]|uniref:Proline-rich protein 36-like n=1 Tax=Phyllostomus discolor TaxID=89673 RepID=A0A7E6DAL5_9CHIR|nr:proline-rich protein 36-like [Phyllostomus discolor]
MGRTHREERVSSPDSPGHVGSGQLPPPSPTQPPVLYSSAFAPRHGRTARACPRHRLRVPNLILRSSGCCREPPYSLLPPGPLQKSRNPASKGARPPALPPPLLLSPRLRLLFPGRPPGPLEPSASAAFSPPLAPPARPVLASRLPLCVSSPSSCCSSSSRSSLLDAPPLSAGGSGAASPLLPQPLVCFFLLLLLLKRSLWPQIATRLPPSAPSSPSLLPPKSEAQARDAHPGASCSASWHMAGKNAGRAPFQAVVIIKERALMRQFVSASIHLGSLIRGCLWDLLWSQESKKERYGINLKVILLLFLHATCFSDLGNAVIPGFSEGHHETNRLPRRAPSCWATQASSIECFILRTHCVDC